MKQQLDPLAIETKEDRYKKQLYFVVHYTVVRHDTKNIRLKLCLICVSDLLMAIVHYKEHGSKRQLLNKYGLSGLQRARGIAGHGCQVTLNHSHEYTKLYDRKITARQGPLASTSYLYLSHGS